MGELSHLSDAELRSCRKAYKEELERRAARREAEQRRSYWARRRPRRDHVWWPGPLDDLVERCVHCGCLRHQVLPSDPPCFEWRRRQKEADHG